MTARSLDKRRAMEARKRHEAGVATLQAIFGYTPETYDKWRETKRAAFPNSERQHRRRQNKTARAARRRNRT